MTLHSIEQALSDSNVLVALAEEADITPASAERLFAALAELPVAQVIRISSAARLKMNRQTRKKSR